MGYRVEPITMDRVEGYRAAVDAVARERKWLLRVEAPPWERSEAFVRRNIEQGNAHFVALAGNDQVVGWCDIYPGEWPGLTHAGELGIGILAGHRGRGLGRRLLEAAIDRAWAAGLRRISLETYASNATAITLYEKLGFEHEGRKRLARLLDGRADDILIMGLLRRDAKE